MLLEWHSWSQSEITIELLRVCSGSETCFLAPESLRHISFKTYTLSVNVFCGITCVGEHRFITREFQVQ